MTIATSTYLKNEIVSIIQNSSSKGISVNDLNDKLKSADSNEEANISNVIESLVSKRHIRAYYPENSSQYYFQLVN